MRLSKSWMLVHVSGAKNYLWKTNKFVFLEVCSMDIHFWRDEITNLTFCWRCVLSDMPRRQLCLAFNQETSSFYDCKKWKASSLVLNIPFKDQKPTFFLFGSDGIHCFAKKTSCDYEKQKPSPFLKKFLNQSQSRPSELEPKSHKSFLLWHYLAVHPICWHS